MVELKADLPSFLKSRAKERVGKEIEEWKSARGSLLEKRKDFLEEYQISGGLDEKGKPKGVDRGNMGIEYQFETAGQGKWQILLGAKKKYASLPKLESWQRTEIEKRLTVNQKIGQTVSKQKNPQMRAINFLEANWKILAEIFSSKQEEASVEAKSFTKVNLSDVTIDFIGLGTDGRYMIFEMGKSGGESRQIERSRQALANLGIPKETIACFRINYSPAAGKNTLLITD